MTITESIDQESRRKTKKSALKKKSTVVVVDVHQHRHDNNSTTTTTIRGGRITAAAHNDDPEVGGGGRHPQQQQQQQQEEVTSATTSRPPTSPPPLSSSYDDLRRQHWKESKYAVGLVNITWSDSRKRATTCSGIWWQSCICSVLNAGRVGNMAVLLQQDEDGAFVCIVGPHWPFLVFATIPMIVIVSGVTVWKGMLSMPWWFILVWSLLSLGLLLVLFLVSCRDPGILKRYSEIPANVVSDNNEQEWTWNDQARTFRPPKAKYDADCAVVVEEFDHTCPWTGTAIGKRNMPWFRVFCGMVLFVLVVDIVVLVGPF